MAQNNDEIKIKYKADVSELNEANKELDADSRLLKKEFILQREQAKALGDELGAAKAQVNYLAESEKVAAEKTDNARKAMEKAVEVYGESSKEAQNMKGKYLDAQIAQQKLANSSKNAQEQLQKLDPSIADKAKEKFEAFADTMKGKVTEGIKGAASVLADGFVTGTKIAIGALAGMATATAGAVAGIYSVTKAGSEMADELLTMSITTGYSTDELQQLKYTAEMVDVSLDTMTSTQTKLEKAMSAAEKGTGAQAEAFSRLGVSIYDQNGELKDSKAIWAETIDALGGVTNETERDILAMELLGKSAKDLNPLIEAGSGALNGFMNEAKDLGMVVSETNLDKLGGLDDAFQKLGGVTNALKGNFGALFAPTIAQNVEGISSAIGGISAALADGFQDSDTDKIMDIIDNVLTDITDQITTQLPKLIKILTPILSKLLTAISQVLPTLLPVLLDGATQLLTALFEFIKNNKELISEMVRTTITNIVSFLVENLPLIVEGGIILLLALVDGITQSLPELIPVIFDGIGRILGAIWEKLPEILAAGWELITTLVAGIGEKLPELWNKGVEILGEVANGISSAIGDIVNIGSDLVRGLWDGIKNMGSWIWDKLSGWASGLLKDVKSFFGIKSPSKEFAGIGNFLMEGLGEGIDDGSGGVLDSITSLGDKIMGTASGYSPEFGEASVNGAGNALAAAGQIIFNVTVRDNATIDYLIEKISEKKQSILQAQGVRYAL